MQLEILYNIVKKFKNLELLEFDFDFDFYWINNF